MVVRIVERCGVVSCPVFTASVLAFDPCAAPFPLPFPLPSPVPPRCGFRLLDTSPNDGMLVLLRQRGFDVRSCGMVRGVTCVPNSWLEFYAQRR